MVKSVVQSILLHTISIYFWPVSLIREIEKWIKNFIWNGDITKRKIVTVAWNKICATYEEGGLNIRSLIGLNEATNLKIIWDLLHSKEKWVIILNSRVLRGTNCINHHIYSSIWSSIKVEYPIVKENSSWLVGDGQQMDFWFDKWCDDPLFETLNATMDLIAYYPKTLNGYIFNAH